MNKYWHKNAVIYSLDVESYLDLNGDGISDFKGLKHAMRYRWFHCTNLAI